MSATAMGQTVGLLLLSNVFMTIAWYAHLRDLREQTLIVAILVSWGIALIAYTAQAPANRIGYTVLTLPQLQMQFAHLETEILLSDVVDANRSWLNRAMVNVASTMELSVHLHKLKDRQPTKDILLDARRALAAGDLAGSADALGKLTGRPAEIAKPWIAEARARLAADKVLRFLDTAAAARLSGGALVRTSY